MDRSGFAGDLLAATLVVMALGIAGTGSGHGSQPAPSRQATSQGTKGQGQSAAPAQGGAAAGSAMHSITVTFDYDFTKTPACSDTVKTQCVAKFSVYDISGSKPYFLFSAPVPKGARGVTKGITATSPQLLFAVGKHRIAVSAREPSGAESPPHDCKVIIEIKAPGDTAAGTPAAR
jgi:hypothetical protein